MTTPNEGWPAPGSVIGYRRNGAAIRLIAGGSQMAPEAPAAPAPEQAPAAQPQPPAAPPEAPRVPPGQPAGGQFAQQPPARPAPPAQPETDWKAEAEKARAEAAQARTEAEAAREDAARHKRQARNQEQRSKANHTQVTAQEAILRQIAEKVGVPYDDRPDPDQLIAQLEQERLNGRQRTIELATFTMAAESGINANAILDSREFMAQAEQLDTSAADFRDQVRDLVKSAASQPRYQFQQPPAPAPPVQEPAAQQPPAQPQQQAPPPPAPPAPSSGSDFSGAPGGNRLWTQADYDYWTAPGMDRDGSVMTKAVADGLLVNLGVGKPRTRGRR